MIPVPFNVQVSNTMHPDGEVQVIVQAHKDMPTSPANTRLLMLVAAQYLVDAAEQSDVVWRSARLRARCWTLPSAIRRRVTLGKVKSSV